MSTRLSLDEERVRECVRSLLKDAGRVETARRLGLSPPTVLALASNARVHMGTLAAAAFALGLTSTSSAA